MRIESSQNAIAKRKLTIWLLMRRQKSTLERDKIEILLFDGDEVSVHQEEYNTGNIAMNGPGGHRFSKCRSDVETS